MSIIIPNGNYKIFSTQYPGQDADLIQGLPTAVIAGYHNNTESSNMVWKLANNNAGNQFTLQNTAPTSDGAYVGVPSDSVTVGAQLHGSTTALTWTVVGTCAAGEYMLLAPAAAGVDVPSGLVWSLSSSADGTPITLQVMTYGSSSGSLYSRAGGYSQAFTFLPWH
ncbi:hypothetical protein V8E55_002967 [Tylopilus felleus]